MKSKLSIAILSFLCGAAAVMLLRWRAGGDLRVVPPRGVLPASLDRRIARVEFHQMPLQTALETLSRQADCPIIVRWSALAAAPVTPYTPVEAELRDVPLSTALKVVLADAEGSVESIDFRAEGPAVLVTTTWDLWAEASVVRLYDIDDLTRTAKAYRLEQVRAATNPAAFHFEPVEAEVNAQLALGDALWSILYPPELSARKDNRVDRAACTFWCGRLVVYQPPEVQAQISAALDALRTPAGLKRLRPD